MTVQRLLTPQYQLWPQSMGPVLPGAQMLASPSHKPLNMLLDPTGTVAYPRPWFPSTGSNWGSPGAVYTPGGPLAQSFSISEVPPHIAFPEIFGNCQLPKTESAYPANGLNLTNSSPSTYPLNYRSTLPYGYGYMPPGATNFYNPYTYNPIPRVAHYPYTYPQMAPPNPAAQTVTSPQDTTEAAKNQPAKPSPVEQPLAPAALPHAGSVTQELVNEVDAKLQSTDVTEKLMGSRQLARDILAVLPVETQETQRYKAILEHLVDDEALKKGNDPSVYQPILLAMLAGNVAPTQRRLTRLQEMQQELQPPFSIDPKKVYAAMQAKLLETQARQKQQPNPLLAWHGNVVDKAGNPLLNAQPKHSGAADSATMLQPGQGTTQANSPSFPALQSLLSMTQPGSGVGAATSMDRPLKAISA